MKKKIIEVTKKLLNCSGVKFTIEDIAKELKISKKTVYKYFEGKEELAKAVFDNIIAKGVNAQQLLMEQHISEKEKLFLYLTEYMGIYRLTSEEIFNLFSLSNQLQKGVRIEAEKNWSGFLPVYRAYCEDTRENPHETEYIKIIIEGLMAKIYHKENRKEILKACLSVIF